ncbi:MAG: ParB/RepB/Spo0J family partition protein [Eubacterium sp.]|nr:ParB/RepB/Spo0J family partition protein [Eubacterium sp.]
MAVRKGGLNMGKGLESLIPQKLKKKPEEEKTVAKTDVKEPEKTVKAENTLKKEEKKPASKPEPEPNSVLEVRISSVVPNSDQPRKEFEDAALTELAESIAKFGVIQPLLVRKSGKYYEIIAGERRWRAAKLAGLKKIPVLVKDYNTREVLEVALIENIQRQDLNPIEEAKAYSRLIEEYELKQEEVAERVSKSRSAIANALRLLKLDERVQQMLIDDVISTGHARCLLGLENPEEQYEAAEKIIAGNLSVRDTERLVKQIKTPKVIKTPPVSEQVLQACRDFEENMSRRLGTRVQLHYKASGKGSIEISYYNPEELERLTALLHSIKGEGEA